MTWLWPTLGALLAGLGAALLAVLVLPVELRFVAERAGHARLRVQLGLLGGGVPWITLSDTDRPRKARRPKPPRPASRDRRRGKDTGRRRPPVGAILRFARDLLRVVRIRSLRVAGTFGFDDPADTGQLYGLIAPLRFGIAGCRRVELDIAPEFSGACLQGRAEGALRLRPVRLVPPAMRLGWAFARVRR
ncbi:DUF2953 domain-containing protein [Thalassococcus sp. CAU 1522]|uniref:DUF2953 domain-containing protein n=1 Tax=Thalassococcus arenae TaxID=2851652 RepID=A0ABS6N498_9RHOB|nr:DUF2953 domain-containing protein [Thalassococcus arenae]MBV2358842.1 DUF2953 domain-containing protein [Thalassococcus arenae]